MQLIQPLILSAALALVYHARGNFGATFHCHRFWIQKLVCCSCHCSCLTYFHSLSRRSAFGYLCWILLDTPLAITMYCAESSGVQLATDTGHAHTAHTAQTHIIAEAIRMGFDCTHILFPFYLGLFFAFLWGAHWSGFKFAFFARHSFDIYGAQKYHSRIFTMIEIHLKVTSWHNWSHFAGEVKELKYSKFSAIGKRFRKTPNDKKQFLSEFS